MVESSWGGSRGFHSGRGAADGVEDEALGSLGELDESRESGSS